VSTALGHPNANTVQIDTPRRVAYFDGQNPVSILAVGGRCEHLDEEEEEDLEAVEDDTEAQCFVLCRPPLSL